MVAPARWRPSGSCSTATRSTSRPTPDSHKAKRIAKGSPVLVWVGSSQGPHFVGHGEIIRDPAQAERMAPVYDQKYWISWLGFFRPRADRIRDGSTVIVRVTPVAGG